MPEERITSKDIEALPGLTKIETIDYHWLVNRAEPRDFREQTRLSQLAEKNRAAVAESINVMAQGSDTQLLKKLVIWSSDMLTNALQPPGQADRRRPGA
jgi:hypothetical protein